MRFKLEYMDYKTKNKENINLKLLDTFLNEYTIDTYCGETFKTIIIKFLNHAPSRRIEKEKKLYNDFAVVEIKSNFKSEEEINVLEFQESFNQVINSVSNVEKINIENKDFNLQTLKSSLKVAEKNIPDSVKKLEEYCQNQEKIDRRNQLRLVNYNIKLNKEDKRELTKHICGIRVYSNLRYEGIDLQPYMFIYENIFTNLLHKEKVMLPGYNEIYVYIHKTLDEAKLSAVSADWSKSTYGQIDVHKYLSSTENEKSKMIFDSICQGLRMISDFDHLNSDSIERAISTVEKEGTNIELIYREKESKNYEVKVTYHVPIEMNEKTLFMLRIKDKISQKEVCVNIDYINLWYAPYSINKINIGKKEIVIEGRKSFRAEVSRQSDNLPDKYLFNIEEVLL